MKRYGYLFDKICDPENIARAHINARKGKIHYYEVKMVDADPERYLENVRKMLANKTYRTSKYKTFLKTDRSKVREIFVLPYYPDRIIQWAVVQVLEPIWMGTLISRTYSSLKNRGIHKALLTLQHDLKDRQATKYCLKLDVKKFYPSINHDILKTTVRQKIKDPDVLVLLDNVIDSTDGVPIGNYLSQFFGNLYLNDFDHWLKETEHIQYYYRYCDDMVILHHDKAFLHDLHHKITQYFRETLSLKIKENWQVFPTFVRGIDFVGYRCFGHYTLLRKTTTNNLKRKLTRIRKFSTATRHDRNVVSSYSGWLKWCDSYRLAQKYVIPALAVPLGD
jgi:retron-type reverse transcriptase